MGIRGIGYMKLSLCKPKTLNFYSIQHLTRTNFRLFCSFFYILVTIIKVILKWLCSTQAAPILHIKISPSAEVGDVPTPWQRRQNAVGAPRRPYTATDPTGRRGCALGWQTTMIKIIAARWKCHYGKICNPLPLSPSPLPTSARSTERKTELTNFLRYLLVPEQKC